MPAKDNFKNEKVEALLEQVKREMEKLGLYMQQAGFVSGEAEDDPVFLNGVFLVGDQAFSERVLDPEQEEIDRQFAALTKVAQPDPAEEIRSKLARELREGKGPLDLDFDD